MEEKKNKPVFLGFTAQGLMQIVVIAAAVLIVFFLFTYVGIGVEKSALDSYSGTPATAEFASCLSQKGAVLYGATWCSHCNSQKSMFGEHVEKITFIDCGESKAVCTEHGITAYPTWIINGEKKIGTQSLGTLAQLTGCELEE